MTIFDGTFIPYEYNSKRDALTHVLASCQEIRHSLRKVEKDSEHLALRLPLSGRIIDIVGTSEDVEWLDKELEIRSLYKP